MKPAALLAFITDIHALGLETAQGLYLTAAWYWDLNDKSRAFGKRFFDKTGAMPTYNQAAYYSATLTYLNAVKAVGMTDADKVMDELHKTKVDDMFTSDGVIRADGLLEHSMYVMQVKTPTRSATVSDRAIASIRGCRSLLTSPSRSSGFRSSPGRRSFPTPERRPSSTGISPSSSSGGMRAHPARLPRSRFAEAAHPAHRRRSLPASPRQALEPARAGPAQQLRPHRNNGDRDPRRSNAWKRTSKISGQSSIR